MALNIEKFKIMNFSKHNPCKEYYIDTGRERTILETTETEKNLEVMSTNNDKNSLKVQTAVLKPHRALRMMRKTFKFISKILFLKLYTPNTHLV